MRSIAHQARASETAQVDAADVVRLLGSPQAFGRQSQRVEQIETHISWVFLTDRFAYKLKKPVRFEFLDFSTPERRRMACEQEVKLNRRLAPNVYLGVEPITLDGDRLALCGGGRAIDWVVKMRRLPEDRALDRLIAAGAVSDRQIDELAEKLAAFYLRLPPINLTSDEYRAHLQQHVDANRAELLDPVHALPAPIVERVHAAQWRLLRLAPEMFGARVADGRIVDGHGDLRPEHVYLAPAPIVIDCIEFNAEFRQIDVADELAFLGMECEMLHAPWIGGRVVDAYRASSGDRFPAELLDFYKTYRACVRAKVLVLRAEQLTSEKRAESMAAARRYLELADWHAGHFAPPCVTVVYGFSGSGKTTLATPLAESLRMKHLSTDSTRRELFPAANSASAGDGEIYRPENRLRVYDEMFERAERALSAGVSPLLDGTFSTAELRERAIALARRNRAVPVLLHCRCSPEAAALRITDRQASGEGDSDATPQVLRRQLALEEPDRPEHGAFEIDTSDSLASALDDAFAAIRCAAIDPAADKLLHPLSVAGG
jgi:aminoglycoside phosphotransferase family enzyme/predicted kinase